MIKTSEWVSLGHPDKVADYISSYILDRYLEKDPKTRYAVEVQIKDNFVSLAGEVTSKHHFSNYDIETFVIQAINEIGYTREYQYLWGKENTICGEDVEVAIHISKQSSDIAAGVDNNGWGDQGIFWGMASCNTNENMPFDYQLAKDFGTVIFENQIGGLDIKTQVTVDDETNKVKELVCAVPCKDEKTMQTLKELISKFANDNHITIENTFINGTGIYVKHGPVGDCGTTGRKLAVDLYGGNCRIGGGSIWTKDGTKADLTLNMYARYLAKQYIHQENNKHKEIHCAISCRIGSPEIRVSFYDEHMNPLVSYSETKTPAELIEKFELNRPIFACLCRHGIFHRI